MDKREELKRIGESIKAQRLLKKMTQINLAELANVSVNTLAKAEKGRSELRIKTMLKISSALNVSLDILTQQSLLLPMAFLAWVEYSNMMFCVSRSETGFVCEKYVGSSKVIGAIKECTNTEELKDFLLSFHNAPEKYILELMSKIQ